MKAAFIFLLVINSWVIYVIATHATYVDPPPEEDTESSYFSSNEIINLPGSICSASQIDKSFYLQARETGLFNSGIVGARTITCPILHHRKMKEGTSNLNISLYAKRLIEGNGLMECTLIEKEGPITLKKLSMLLSLETGKRGVATWPDISVMKAVNNLIISCDLPAGVEISSITISNDLTYEKILTNSSNLSFKKSNSAHPAGYIYPISLRLPDTEADKNPLIILLHGNGGNGSAMITNLRNLFEDHIIIAPTGFENSWNIAEEKSNLPDVEFLRDLIRDLKLFSNVDENRIRLFGTSNGAALANRAFIEIDDPSIDMIIAVVSQLHEGQYRNDKFYAPSDESKIGREFGVYKGYDVEVVPNTSRKYLSITNHNDRVIGYEGGEYVGLDFLNSQDAIYAAAKSQGYAGPKIADAQGQLYANGIYKYIYLNGQVVHVKGSAGHGLDANLKEIIVEFLRR